MAHWQEDRAAFKAKFGIAYGAFTDLLSELPAEDQERYETIQATSLKAAILWAIDQAKVRGLASRNGTESITTRPKGFADVARETLAQVEARDREREYDEE